MSITVDRLTKRYGPVIALDQLSMGIDPGEIVVLLGTNGAGKTSALDCLVGVRRPTSGAIRYQGREVGGLNRALPRGLGFLPEMLEGFDLLTVRQNVLYFAQLYEVAPAVDRILDRLDLTAIAHRKYGKCSHGERIRTNLACALVPEPAVLVLDEPTIGLDPASRHRIWDLLRECRSAGRMILFSTHYLDEAEALGDRVVILKEGRCVAQGPVREIVDRFSEGGGVEIRGLPQEDGVILAEHLRHYEVRRNGDHTFVPLPREHCLAEVISVVENQGLRCEQLQWRRKNLESAFLHLMRRSDAA